MMRTLGGVIVVGVLCAAGTILAQPPMPSADKPFVAGGSINIQLPGGEYDIRAAADNRIRVAVTKNPGSSKIDIVTSGNSATVKITDSPMNNFGATLELPRIANLTVHMSGGALTIGPFTGHKDVDSYGGDVTIHVGDPNEYATVDASVKVGDIDASAFGGSKSGFFQNFQWSGKGKYRLRARLGAGDLKLK